jgi:hypothetical protein
MLEYKKAKEEELRKKEEEYYRQKQQQEELFQKKLQEELKRKKHTDLKNPFANRLRQITENRLSILQQSAAENEEKLKEARQQRTRISAERKNVEGKRRRTGLKNTAHAFGRKSKNETTVTERRSRKVEPEGGRI